MPQDRRVELRRERGRRRDHGFERRVPLARRHSRAHAARRSQAGETSEAGGNHRPGGIVRNCFGRLVESSTAVRLETGSMKQEFDSQRRGENNG